MCAVRDHQVYRGKESNFRFICMKMFLLQIVCLCTSVAFQAGGRGRTGEEDFVRLCRPVVPCFL